MRAVLKSSPPPPSFKDIAVEQPRPARGVGAPDEATDCSPRELSRFALTIGSTADDRLTVLPGLVRFSAASFGYRARVFALGGVFFEHSAGSEQALDYELLPCPWSM